jgi:Zn-dependent protease
MQGHLENWIVDRLLFLIPLWLSLSVHEWAHAWMAWRLGDDTARLQGRMTLNPLAHIDPFGTLVLPLMGIPFGWAKPVPINPLRFGRQVSFRMGVLLTAAAGPLSNMVMALGSIGLLALTLYFRLGPDGIGAAVHSLLQTLVWLNVILAVFNLLPIPPLDGSRVVDALVPDSLRSAWDRFCQAGPGILALVLLLPLFLGLSLFAWPFQAVQAIFDQLQSWLR